jgi:hypothetical protein
MISKYDKAIVALVMAVLGIAAQATGLNFGLDEATVTTIVGLVTSALVFIVPNKKA